MSAVIGCERDPVYGISITGSSLSALIVML